MQFCPLNLENEILLVLRSSLKLTLPRQNECEIQGSYLISFLRTYTISSEQTAVAPRHGIQREACCHLLLFPAVFPDTLECCGQLSGPTRGSGCSGWMVSCESLEPTRVTLCSKRVFADGIELRVLQWGGHIGILALNTTGCVLPKGR